MTEQLHFHFSFSCIGEGNGNPLQCSCLENPRDRGAWWAAVYGIAQSRTRLKRLSSSSSSSRTIPEGGMATPSNIAPRESPWTENPGRYGPWGREVSDTTEQLSTAQDSTKAMRSPGDAERNNVPSQSRTYTSEGRWACLLGSGR